MMFSIVIPTFKRNELLRKCLNSLSMQSYKDFEVVIVNDDPFEIYL
ncbi:glycosyltransferase family 2 protein [Photobacterium leiognathi subsp. mandapamensis]